MSSPGRPRLAFLDESQSHRIKDPDTYILAAGVCAAGDADAGRAALSAVRLKGQLKLHWRDESHRRRMLIAHTVAAAPLEHLVVVRDGRAGESPERRRRHCLERMLYELDQLKVARAVFESRGRADDNRDRAMLDAMRARRTISAELRMDHVRGPQEALLWVPDAVCGAVSHYRAGDQVYLQIIEAAVPIRLITIAAL